MTVTSETAPDIDLTPTEARALTDRIKVAVEGTWLLIEQAYLSRAWAALGYTSWDVYCTREFGTARLRLPREERQEVVQSLRESGLSIRAIASVTGIAKNTVISDLQVSQIETPAPKMAGTAVERHSAGSTSSTMSQPQAPSANAQRSVAVLLESADDADDEDDERSAPQPPAPRVAGTDGKSYAASRPTSAPAKPRTDIPRVINGALIQIDSARRALENLTRAQITNQSGEARRAWTANLSESVEALGGFLTNLSPEG